jgi:hypothetical protein
MEKRNEEACKVTLMLTPLCDGSFPPPVPHSNMDALQHRGRHVTHHEVWHEGQGVLKETKRKRKGEECKGGGAEGRKEGRK